MRTRAWAIAAAAALMVAGCGGGGGGGGDSGQLGPEGGAGLTVSPPSLTYTYLLGGLVPPPQNLTVSWSSNEVAGFVAGFVAPVPDPGWVSATPGGCGFHVCSVSIAVDALRVPTAPGTYTTTLSVIVGTSQEVPLGYRNVPITFVRRRFGVEPAAVASSAPLGSAPASRDVIVGGAWGTAWNITAHPSFVVPSATSGTTTSNVPIGFDPTGLGTGTHHGVVTFTTASDTVNLDVSLTITDP